MKVALILSGQLRTFNLCKWSIKSIKEQYDCDIFLVLTRIKAYKMNIGILKKIRIKI